MVYVSFQTYWIVISHRRALARAQVLRATSTNSPLPPRHYRALSSHLIQAFIAGSYLKDGPPSDDPDAPKPGPVNPLTDPGAMEGMMDGMKKQMVMMVPQMVIMGWINFFFQGFVLSESIVSAIAWCVCSGIHFIFPAFL